MNDWQWAITLATCCGICLTITPSASADFVGVTAVNKDDQATDDLCAQGHGQYVPGPLTVYNIFAVFDNPDDTLLALGNADLQVYNGASPDVFFQHPLHASPTAYGCYFLDWVSPDLICNTFVTIGYKCGPAPHGTDQTTPDDDFDFGEFQCNGHVVGGWFDADTSDPQGNAGVWPDLQVLFMQSAVAQGRSMSGDIDIFWKDGETGETVTEVDVPIECAAVDQEPCECIDGSVTLCHISPGNRGSARTITVGCGAADKHLAHGDTCGRCPYGYCAN